MKRFLVAALMGLLIGSLAFAQTSIKSNIGKEDINWAAGGTGAAETFSRRTSTGGTITLTRPDATHIYLRTGASPLSVNDALTAMADVRAYGAVGDGSANDTEAIQAAIDTGKPVFLPDGTYRITDTLNFQSLAGGVFRGSTPSGQTNTCKIKWDGVNGGTVIYVKDTRDYLFENFRIEAGTGTIGVGIDIDYTEGNVPVSTNQTYRGVSVGASTTGIRISQTATNNNDLHVFEGVYIDGAGTYGYYIGDTSALLIKIIGGSVGERTYGIYVDAGTFASWGTNFSLNTKDIYLVNTVGAISITAPQSESADMFLDSDASASSPWPVTISGGRLAINSIASDNVYINYKFSGPLNIIGNEFTDGTAHAGFRIKADGETQGPVVTAIGNSFPNNIVFQNYEDDAVENDFTLNSIGNSYAYATNVFYPMETFIGKKWGFDKGGTSFSGITGLSGEWKKAHNFRGRATFDTAATVAVAFTTAEADQDYYVVISGNDNETFFVNSKTANGFTLNSSNASSVATVEWILVR